jgi:hypothetical protein
MADAATIEFPELALVDELIAGLEALITESDETPLSIDATQRPRRSLYRNLGTTSPLERKTHHCDAVYLDGQRLTLRCNNTELVRQTPLEIMIQAEKSGRGETMAIIKGRAREIKRIRGGYDIDVDIAEMRKTRTTPSQKLRECLHKNDAAGWNRWIQDIHGRVELTGMDLKSAELSGYDLCCADFTGSDFTGANLGGAVLAGADLRKCVMERVSVAGADLFRARLDRVHAPLASQSGMPETESIILDDG